MKILFTSVGRRVELIQAFRNAAIKCETELKIFGTDMSTTAPALSFCDYTQIVPAIKSSEYLPTIIEICKKENIDALVPTIDTELLLLSQNKEKFGKTKVIISEQEKIAVCRNKMFTADYFHSVGLKSPSPVDDYTKYIYGFPAFIKPKDGSSSIFAYKANNIDELKAYAEEVPNYIVQPFIEGVEYTVDAFCDFDGKPIYITPRIRLATRSGEVSKTQIAQDAKIIFEMQQLIAEYKPCGQITVQLIKERTTSEDYYIEINPRFGGGAPLSIKAGADSAEALIRILNGELLTYQPNAAEDGAIYSRFDQSIKVK